MAIILFLIEAIERDIFRRIYLKKKNIFLNFFVHFLNVHQIFNIFKKR